MVHPSAALGCSALVSWGLVAAHLGTWVSNLAWLMHVFAEGCWYQQRSVPEPSLSQEHRKGRMFCGALHPIQDGAVQGSWPRQVG